MQLLLLHFFSIVIDETTDVTVDTQLAVMVQYWNPYTCQLDIDVLDFVQCKDATADGLSNAVLSLLDKLGIRSKLVKQFASF